MKSTSNQAHLSGRLSLKVLSVFGSALIAVSTFHLAGCEMSNYAPPVTTEIARTSSAKKQIDQNQLKRGRTLFVHRCIECHTLPPMWKYSREDWPQIVNDMSHRASLKPEEREAVIAYILAVRREM
jgi:mono/diheme cytochrome c family protein